jgi:hypothetical protein
VPRAPQFHRPDPASGNLGSVSGIGEDLPDQPFWLHTLGSIPGLVQINPKKHFLLHTFGFVSGIGTD